MPTPKKETGVKKTSVKSAPKKETKAELFIRLAEPRVKKVLKSFRILGNCSNRGNYEYSNEQVVKMFETLSTAYNVLVNKFSQSKEQQETFKF